MSLYSIKQVEEITSISKHRIEYAVKYKQICSPRYILGRKAYTKEDIIAINNHFNIEHDISKKLNLEHSSTLKEER